MQRDNIHSLVRRELARIGDASRRAALEAILVEPRMEVREWDYGEPDERYPYWVVAEARERGIILVHCEHGFGPGDPWGFLFTHDPGFETLGMDSQWYGHLEHAFTASGLQPRER